MSNLNVFLSYCHEDEQFKLKLLKYLKPVLKGFNASLWHDGNILTGQSLEDSIQEALEQSTIFICLISSDYLASDYCIDKELEYALDKQKIGKANIFPVVLRKCNWTHTIFYDLKCQSKDAKPVIKWDDEDDVYTEISDELAKVLKSLTSNNIKKKVN